MRIDGQDFEVRCQVRSISGFSAHADEPELLAWLGHLTQKPRTTFIVHGDPAAQAAFEPKVRELGFPTAVPSWRETVELVGAFVPVMSSCLQFARTCGARRSSRQD